MSRALKETSQFKTDKKRIKRSGRYDWGKMRALVKELMNDRPLDEKHYDHKLSGELDKLGVLLDSAQDTVGLILMNERLPVRVRKPKPGQGVF